MFVVLDHVCEHSAQEDQRSGVSDSLDLESQAVMSCPTWVSWALGNLTQVVCRSSTHFEPLSRLSSPRFCFFKSGCFWRLFPPLSFRALRRVSTKQKKKVKKSALCSVDIT